MQLLKKAIDSPPIAACPPFKAVLLSNKQLLKCAYPIEIPTAPPEPVDILFLNTTFSTVTS